MKEDNQIPPKLAERLLLFFLRADLAEEVLGDLDEQFFYMLQKKSLKQAKLNYWLQVFNYLRPFAIKKIINNRSTFIIMFKHNFLISYRSFARFKTTFLINLIGLSSGLACAILIYLWVMDEVSYDKFHENKSRLFQVIQEEKAPGFNYTTSSTPVPLAQALRDEFPEVEAATPVLQEWYRKAPGLITTNNSRSVIKASEYFIEGKDFFEIFSYDLLEGNLQNPLPDNQSVLISDQLADKLFNRTDNIVGETVEWEQEGFSGSYGVMGVFEAPPRNSTMQFDLLFPMELKASTDSLFNQWENSNPYTYLLLKEGIDYESFNTKIKDYYKTKVANSFTELFSIQYSRIYLEGIYADKFPFPTGRDIYVILFSLIALFILGIACINFMNLTTAKASNRLKEIGVKKAVGASRKSLIGQYFSESILLTSMSLFVALAMVFMLLPQFNEITGKYLTLQPTVDLFLGCIVITFMTGLLAGSYPALYLSAFKPIAVLKGKLNASFGDTWIRKGLVVFQFVISASLIVGVIVISEQLNYMHEKNLGFNRNNILQFEFKAESEAAYESFLDEIQNIQGVRNATPYSQNLTGMYGMTNGVSWEGKSEDANISFVTLQAGYDFLKTVEIEMLDGRAYDYEKDRTSAKIVLNESAIKAMGIEDPVGKTIDMWGTTREIIGVAKDFHFASLYEKVKPCVVIAIPSAQKTMVKIEEGMEEAVIAAVETSIQKRRPGVNFDYTFLDDDFKKLYDSENRIVTLSRISSFVAILISCLGLLGLTAFTAEKRKKEIGIRKVMGSSNFNIILLLSGSFTKMVVLALFIALPLCYLLATTWLQNFTYQVELNGWYFGLTALVILGVAWFTVGLQTLKAARLSPTKTLKEE